MRTSASRSAARSVAVYLLSHWRLACAVVVALAAIGLTSRFFYGGAATVAAKAEVKHASAEPTITTDRQQYSPGDAITFTGKDFKPGEIVTILLSEDTSGRKVRLRTRADGTGTFSVSGQLPMPPRVKATGRRAPDDQEMEYRPGEYTATALGSSGANAEIQFSTADEDSDGDRLLEQEGFWMQRLTYPTGKFDARWVRQAAEQDKRIARGIPVGIQRDTIKNFDLLHPYKNLLDAAGFTALGPLPEKMTGCSGCYDYGTTAGRVNSIAVDPTTTTNGSIVAYIATVGGGVWKSTNCCSSATSWIPVTDSTVVSTTSVDTVTIDPSNHNTIYAGTGDLNYGSFSMGSQGILKSTDAGATWSVVGANVFGAALAEPAGQFPQYQAVGKVRVDPNSSNKVVAGTKTGLYFSYDSGANWTGPCLPDNFSTQRQDITGLELTNIGGTTRILAAVGTRGFATPVQYNLDQNGANGLYKGTMPASGCPSDFTLVTRNDNGFNFGVLTTGSPYGTGASMNAGTGVPYGGNTTTGNQLGRMDIAVAPGDPNTIYAQVGSIAANSASGCGSAAGCQLGVWASNDGGTTWTFMTGSAGGSLRACGTGTTSGALGSGDYPQNWYDQGIAVDPNNPDRIFVDTFDTWVATRTGLTFYNLTCGYNGSALANHVVHTDHHALAFVNGSSSLLLEGSDGGIFSTSNADVAAEAIARPTWVNMDNGLNTIEFYSGDISGNFASSATPSAAGGAQDNGPSTALFSSPVGAVQWQMGTGGDGFFARIDPVGTGSSLRYWLGNNSGGLSRCVSNCTSGGATWSSRRGAWTGDTQSFVLPFEIFHGDVTNSANDCGVAGAATGCGHLIAGTVRVWETVTGAASSTVTWYVNSPANLTKQTLGNRSYINQLAFEPASQNTVMVGTNDGNVQIGFNMGGGSFTSTWVNVTGGNSVLPNRPVLDVAFDPKTTTAPIAYAAVGGFDQNTPTTPGHVFKVTCSASCASFVWEDKTGNLPNIPADSIIANPNFPQQVFVGTDFGLYYTDDIRVASPTWTRFNAGLPNVMIWDMAIDRGNTTLSLWTRGRGAFAWPLPLSPIQPLPTTVGASTTATGNFGGTVTLTATLTENGFPVANKLVNFSLNTSAPGTSMPNASVGSATTDASGVATLSGVSLSGLAAGSYPNAVGLSFTGDSGYVASTGSGNLLVSPATSITTVNCPATVPYTGTPRTPCSAGYTTSDGLAAGLTVSYTNNTAAGTATAAATYPGDPNHDTSNDSKTFQILAPTAATVSVAGRVMDGSGFAIRGARVILTGTDGRTYTAITNAFGYYSLANVTAGQNYLLAGTARGFTFSSRVLSVMDQLTGIDLVAGQ